MTGFGSSFCSIFESSSFQNDQTSVNFHFNEDLNNDIIGSFEKFTDASNNLLLNFPSSGAISHWNTQSVKISSFILSVFWLCKFVS